MARTLLCFGDSNTHGSPPMPERAAPYERYGPGIRWPTVTAAALGPDWTVIEEGLPGRTAQFDDPVMGPHMNGQIGLKIALNSHGPLDMVAIMLGTNDCKPRFGGDARTIVGGIASLVDIAQSVEMQARHGGLDVLLICPPPVEEAGCLTGEFFGGAELSRALPPLYQALAEARGCGFLDAGKIIEVSTIDGVHYAPEAQRTLGEAIAREVAARA
ncbi:SGNH/GDSL hydrolase family protein [Ponticoccus sp. SC2-23]|uniref:SGNH/GDSL hydrolase family protein n=1 Tax=Alexandriicola marinus TaxID=2081710 RepID=UPI000FDA01E2|nr:SGNH/GDSL hydrolase family protein [Alexandriicola marinus]MBM1220569.1 SGNH/GDSL hydrolase family protein [Ponticoccus sp. SC6-9]MBM1225255.1 SGNH/GDSL hydrolase family protein [Ponticoccus sp. SC6-15]MBM1228769.1 SGNH/GDSL hydrolase family protein [Ponticoccus sp. SC6-38]MBM1233594.1 SGNH/GDSL hydrolase family protein [Ponticoccus sp. SC6-45]MBM1239270.1 SGNH/GDSL hydrolase family protein [Ponticoccus sp. SC6-49]MBM1243052.1 SGNH/GDSL hydrolase family protein [Ponticoccus sp. SC2-64]MBM